MNFRILVLIILLQGCTFSAGNKDKIHTRVEINSPELVVYKAPEGAPRNDTYDVFVRYEGGDKIDLYEYDAGVDGGYGKEPAGHKAFVSFDSDFSKKIDVKVIRKAGDIKDVQIPPASAGPKRII